MPVVTKALFIGRFRHIGSWVSEDDSVLKNLVLHRPGQLKLILADVIKVLVFVGCRVCVVCVFVSSPNCTV